MLRFKDKCASCIRLRASLTPPSSCKCSKAEGSRLSSHCSLRPPLIFCLQLLHPESACRSAMHRPARSPTSGIPRDDGSRALFHLRPRSYFQLYQLSFRVFCLKEQRVTSGHPLQQATTPTDRISKVKRMRAATKAATPMETLTSFRTTIKSVSFYHPLALFRQDVLMTLSPSDRNSTICARSISSRPKDLSDPRSWASLRQHMSSKLTKSWKRLPMSKALWLEFLRTLWNERERIKNAPKLIWFAAACLRQFLPDRNES